MIYQIYLNCFIFLSMVGMESIHIKVYSSRSSLVLFNVTIFWLCKRQNFLLITQYKTGGCAEACDLRTSSQKDSINYQSSKFIVPFLINTYFKGMSHLWNYSTEYSIDFLLFYCLNMILIVFQACFLWSQ